MSYGCEQNVSCGSGTLRLRWKIPLLFGEKILKTVCFDLLILRKYASLRFFPLPGEDLVDSGG
jgi:hypothetical protein